jgi:hypothetical protein
MRHHHHRGLSAAASLVHEGSTSHFNVSYENSLGPRGKELAVAVLARAERDFAALQRWFGGIDIRHLPFSVNIMPGQNGASHATCMNTTLDCDAFDGTDHDLVRMCVVAEADEVFMANQDMGWDCGGSNGEALSRVLAAELYPASLNGFASASVWLAHDRRPDFVSKKDASDTNFTSIGCSALFINYLRHQLGFSLTRIVEAGGKTLEDTYQALTGDTGGFAPFSTLLKRHFPLGRPVRLSSDNPFPLA